MRRAIAVSAGAHVLAAGLLALWLHRRPLPPEVPATIEILFGSNAEQQGAPAASAAPANPTQAGTAAGQPEGDGVAAPPAARAPGGGSRVRLGDGDLGLRLDATPDPHLIEAQSDPGNRAPKYPEAASQRHEQGLVVVRMHIDPAGRVAAAEVLESSGHPALDEAARLALLRWHFIPALRDGVAVPSYRDQPTNFVLE